MKLDIRAGKPVLFREKNQWHVGELIAADATVNEKGLFLQVNDLALQSHTAEINDIFLDAVKIDEYFKNDPETFMTLEEYINFIESDDFIRSAERAFVSDGEYYYYSINKFARGWLEKQGFPYVFRMQEMW